MDYDHILPQNDFAFGKIMEDKETCKRFIEQALNIKIRDLVYLEKQKTLDPAIDVKGIRLDVFVEDDQNTVYNIEMQSANRGELPKRSRSSEACGSNRRRNPQNAITINRRIVVNQRRNFSRYLRSAFFTPFFICYKRRKKGWMDTNRSQFMI